MRLIFLLIVGHVNEDVGYSSLIPGSIMFITKLLV